MRRNLTVAFLAALILACLHLDCGSKNPVRPDPGPVTIVNLVTATFTPTGSPTATFTFTQSPTITPSPTSTYTPVTILVTATFTPTFTATNSPTNSPTPTPTRTSTSTFTATNTPTPTNTGTSTYTPTSTPTNCSSFGGTGVVPYAISGPAYTECSVFTLSTGVIVNSLRAELTSYGAGYNVNLAIYSDAAGSPGTLIAQAVPQSMVVGWNEVPLSPTTLGPGNYWLAVKGSGTSQGVECDSSQPGNILSNLGDIWNGGNFPASFAANNTNPYYKLAIRANYCANPSWTPPPTATPTYTWTATRTPTLTPTKTNTPTVTNSPTNTPTFTSTYTPTPCATNGIMGETSGVYTGSQDAATNLFFYTAFTAPASGTLRDAHVWAIGDVGSTLRVLIYDNAGGQMTNLVASSASYTFTSNTGAYQHIILPMPSAALTGGQTYYLGAFLPVAGSGYQFLGAGLGSLGTWEVQGFVQSPASWIGSAFQSSPNSMTIYVDFCQ